MGQIVRDDLMFVGETNPYGTKAEMALYHLPRTAVGNRMRILLGLSDVEYSKISKANLCQGKWDAGCAREEVSRLVEERNLRAPRCQSEGGLRGRFAEEDRGPRAQVGGLHQDGFRVGSLPAVRQSTAPVGQVSRVEHAGDEGEGGGAAQGVSSVGTLGRVS